MLAGVPMMNGASTLEGYTPEIDATIVTRILDAGGTILGKAHCEYFCLSGGSHTNATGPVHNPHKMGYSAGGSSSGSAVLVALGEADMAIGGDQGGSIRMPSSFCGIYGMKPTHGLVPYTGIMPIEIYVDHTGPMTAHRQGQRAAPRGDRGRRRLRSAPVRARGASLHGGARPAASTASRSPSSRRASACRTPSATWTPRCARRASCSASSGAKVTEVSIPWHTLAGALWLPIGVEGLTQTMMWGDGYGLSRPDLYVTSLMDFHRGLAPSRQRAVGDHEALHAARHLHPRAARQPLLRQGDEHHPAPDRGLRRGPRRARPPADAHDADEGAADAEAGRAARGGRAAGARDDHATPRPSTSRTTRRWRSRAA